MQLPPEWFRKAVNTHLNTECFFSQGSRVCYSGWAGDSQQVPLVVLVHGTGAHRHWWDFIAPHFVGPYNLIALDLAGMGDSEHRDAYSIANMGEDICALVEHFMQQSQPRRVVLIGHSMGGFAVLSAASQRPDLFHQLIVLDSPVRPPDYDYDTHQSSSPIRRRKVYPDHESAMLRFRLTPYQECENEYILHYIAHHSIAECDDGYCWKFDDALMKKFQGRRNPHLLSEAKVSVHFMYGGESALVYGDILKHIKSELPIEHITEIPGAAHHLFLDKPIEFVAAVRQVLERV